MELSEVYSILYNGIIYITISFVIFLIGKFVYELFNRGFSVQDELVEKSNLAFAFAYMGYFIGLLIVIGAAIIGPSNGILTDAIEIGVYGLLGIVLLNISMVINDKVILRKFSIKKEIITDRNVGTGIIEAAVAISSGLIIFGAINGETEYGWGFNILSAVVFWAAGLVALFIISLVYQAMTSYDVHEHIEKDNVAVGIGFSGVLIAVANLIQFGLHGDFDGWGYSFAEAGFELLVGIILLPTMRFITDKILLPGQRLTHEIIKRDNPNIGAALVEAFAYISGSVFITWCL